MRKTLLALLLISLSLVVNAKEIDLSKVKGVDQDIIISLSPEPMTQTVKRGENIIITFSKKLKHQTIKKSIKLKYLGCEQTKKEKLKSIRDENLQKCKSRFGTNKNLKKSCKQCVREIYRCQKERICKPREIRGTTKYFENKNHLQFNPYKKLRPGYYQITVKGLHTEDNTKIKKLLYRFEVSKNQIDSINLMQDEITLKKGENKQLTLQAIYKDGTSEEITESINWIIGDSTLISVDTEGNLEALKEGETLLQAEYYGKTSKEIMITVEPEEIVIINTPPVAQKQTITVDEDTSQDIILTATDKENDTLSFEVTTQPMYGKLTGKAPNLTYTPNENYNGSDSFAFKVNDGKLDSSIVTIPINITSINDKPTVDAGEDIESIEQLPITLNAMASDIDGEIKSYQWSEGNITLSTTASFSKDDFTVGEHTLTITVTDNEGASASDTITIKILAANTPPVIKTQTVETTESKAISFTLEATDHENDTLSFQITKQPSHGALTGTAPNLTYTPTTHYIGQDNFSIKANDGKDDSEVVTIMIDVKAEVINGHTLPPEPDPAINNATLLGVDSNGNGVRDDVERWIYLNPRYDHPIIKATAMQNAGAFQKILINPSNAKETKKYMEDAHDCIAYYQRWADAFGEKELIPKYIKIYKESRPIILNTRERSKAYHEYNLALSGGVYPLRHINTLKSKCDFDIDSVMEYVQ